VKVEDKLLEGPKDDLGGFLSAVNQLHTNVQFLKQNQSFKATSFALEHANGLLSKSMTQLVEEFKNLFNEHRFGNFNSTPFSNHPFVLF
jgi:exocyst complex protein 7